MIQRRNNVFLDPDIRCLHTFKIIFYFFCGSANEVYAYQASKDSHVEVLNLSFRNEQQRANAHAQMPCNSPVLTFRS